MTGRELFEKIYNDEMAIPESHVFGDAQELDFEDADIREAAYAGFVLAMNAAQESMSNARQVMEKLKFAVNGPVNSALLALDDEQDTLSNFHYQLARHKERSATDPAHAKSLWPVEAVQDFAVCNLEQVSAPASSICQLPVFTLRKNKHFKIGYVLDFAHYNPIGFTTNTLHMANNPQAGKTPAQCVFLVLEILGDPDLYPSDFATSSREAYGALGKFANRCRNICGLGEITPLGSSMNGSVVRALALPMFVKHDQFAKAQK